MILTDESNISAPDSERTYNSRYAMQSLKSQYCHCAILRHKVDESHMPVVSSAPCPYP